MLCLIANATSTAVRVSYAAKPIDLLVRLHAVHGYDLRMLSMVNGGPAGAVFLHALFSDDHIDGGWFAPSNLPTALFAHLARHTADDDEADWLLSQARIALRNPPAGPPTLFYGGFKPLPKELPCNTPCSNLPSSNS